MPLTNVEIWGSSDGPRRHLLLAAADGVIIRGIALSLAFLLWGCAPDNLPVNNRPLQQTTPYDDTGISAPATGPTEAAVELVLFEDYQ